MALRAALLDVLWRYAWRDESWIASSLQETRGHAEAVAAALKALGLNDPCRLEEWPER